MVVLSSMKTLIIEILDYYKRISLNNKTFDLLRSQYFPLRYFIYFIL